MLITIKPVMLSASIPINGFGEIYPNYHLKPINVLFKKNIHEVGETWMYFRWNSSCFLIIDRWWFQLLKPFMGSVLFFHSWLQNGICWNYHSQNHQCFFGKFSCVTKALPLESGTTPTMITAETMQMAITFTDTLATIKGISELVSLIFSVFSHVTHALTTVTVCHLCVRLSLTTKE